MRANVDFICTEMDRDPRNAELQISSLNSFYSALKDEKRVEQFQRAFKSIDNALKANSTNDAVILSALKLFDQLVQIRPAAALLESTSIFSQLMFILNAKKEDPHISEVCLLTISQTIAIPRMGSHFSSQQFIKTLVFVARLNSKSQIHAMYLANIAMFLNPRLEMMLKDLCVAFVVLSRNFPRNEQLQEGLIAGFAQLSGSKILNEVASLAIPHFTDIALRYIRNTRIIKSLLTILAQSPANSIQDVDFTIIMDQCKRFKDDPQVIMKSIEIIFTKMDPKQTPIEVIPLVTMALSMFLSNTAVLKQTLTLCYYAVTSGSEDAPISPKLIQLLTSILLVHNREPSLIRRASAILHSLSSNQGNDIFLAQASAPFALLQAIQTNIKDQHSVECIVASLSNFISNNQQLATQICTPDHLKTLKQVCSNYKKDIKVMKSALLLIKSLALAKYGFTTFIDLPSKQKEDYYIDKKIGVLILKKQLSNYSLVKSVLLLMPPSPDESSLIGAAMIKYSKDEEIQYAGLLHNISDLSAINRALLLCGEKALRYAVKSLQSTEEILPPQTIDFLLSLDRCDAIDILMTQISRASASAIASQFSLKYLEQVVIGHKLHEMSLWEPSEEDSSLIITSLYHSTYDPRQLFASLSFAKEIGLTDSSFPFLIDAISRYPTNRDVVAICAEFISALNPNKQIESYCLSNNAVSTTAFALEFSKKDEPVAYSLLKMIHFLSGFESLILNFSQSIIISIISKTAKLSKRCNLKCCSIFTNLVKNKECAIIMKNNNIDEIVFAHFCVEIYELVEILMDTVDLTLSYDQFEIVMNQFNQLSSKVSANDTIYILQILLKCYEKNEEQIIDLNFKNLIPLLTVYASNGAIIQLASRLVSYSEGYKQNEELLFALLEALKFNIDNYETTLAIIDLIPHFFSVNKHQPTFAANPTIELFCELLRKYSSDVIICSTSFKILKGQPIDLGLCATVMQQQTDIESLMSISQYILSICEEYDISSIIDSIFKVLELDINNVDLYENLLPAVFYSTNNEATHDLVLSNFDIIIKLFVRYTGSSLVSLAFLGIMCNIATRIENIELVEQYAPMIGVAMKAFVTDVQIQQAGSQAICNFAAAGKGDLFYTTLPVLDMALRHAIELESTCDAITKLADNLGEFAPLFAADLLQLMKQDSENMVLLASCLQSILKYKRAEDIVFDRILAVFEMIDLNQDETIASALLDLCASLKNYEKLILFEPVLPNLMTLIKQPKYKVAVSAANCILTLASIRPEIVDPYTDEIMHASQKASGELLRVFLQIKQVLYGIRRKM
ncbi:hypothetical protein TRFO_40394 [Tritrichomonas foetus]|uniref:Uncharacterized protein n=1 Tax=Tritrichomonas foetus TaxID=1144522 RepID=A0A1J4J1P8_9EUKA|nr:hypothetical protein TRFO_40394 [Tritrichomonas foetus]|eukprot:OHS93330.1 hypothetical protein TRFO_40394 [Tritrichomonas foetus]